MAFRLHTQPLDFVSEHQDFMPNLLDLHVHLWDSIPTCATLGTFGSTLWDVALPELLLLLRCMSTWTSVHPFRTFVANPWLHANPNPLGHQPQSTQPNLANSKSRDKNV